MDFLPTSSASSRGFAGRPAGIRASAASPPALASRARFAPFDLVLGPKVREVLAEVVGKPGRVAAGRRHQAGSSPTSLFLADARHLGREPLASRFWIRPLLQSLLRGAPGRPAKRRGREAPHLGPRRVDAEEELGHGRDQPHLEIWNSWLWPAALHWNVAGTSLGGARDVSSAVQSLARPALRRPLGRRAAAGVAARAPPRSPG